MYGFKRSSNKAKSLLDTTIASYPTEFGTDFGSNADT